MSRIMHSRLAVPLVVAASLMCGDPAGVNRDDGISVLFIGNSLTGVNDLPAMVGALITWAGYTPTIGSITPGGYGLPDHWVTPDTRDAIRRGGWDVVVLQQGPSATEGRPYLLAYADSFAAEIRAVKACPALYMVWPDTVRFFDFDGVSDSYATAARRVGGFLFAAGEAWRAAWRLDGRVPLYGSDGFHPSPAGTYLAALVIAAQLTGVSPMGMPAMLIPPGGSPARPLVELDESLARLLQQAAAEANQQFALKPTGSCAGVPGDTTTSGGKPSPI